MKRYTFKDWSQYVEGKHRDGGCYGFATRYTERVDGNFLVSYHSTSNFCYCERCGTFVNFKKGRHRCSGYEMISAETMQRIVNDFQETDTEWMEVIEADNFGVDEIEAYMDEGFDEVPIIEPDEADVIEEA